MQKEITSRTELLDKDGNLAVCGWARRNLFVYECGWARRNLFVYDRERVRRRNRLKEWDFYQASDGNMLVQVNFFNIAIASAATAAVIDMRTGERAECASITLGTVNRLHLPEVSDKPNEFSYSKGGVSLRFVTTFRERRKGSRSPWSWRWSLSRRTRTSPSSRLSKACRTDSSSRPSTTACPAKAE